MRACPSDHRPRLISETLRALCGQAGGHICSWCWKGLPSLAHSLPCSWQLQDLVQLLAWHSKPCPPGHSLPLRLHHPKQAEPPARACVPPCLKCHPHPSPLRLEPSMPQHILSISEPLTSQDHLCPSLSLAQSPGPGSSLGPGVSHLGVSDSCLRGY